MSNIEKIPQPAVVFLLCITAVLFLMVLFLLYVKQIACCRYLPTPLCFSERSKAQNMDDSDEEIFDKFEDLMNCCHEKYENPVTVDVRKVEQFKLDATKESAVDITDSEMESDPTIQVGLRYHPNNGKLSVNVIKGNYIQSAEEKIDCYIKLLVCTDTGYQLSHVDTKVVGNEMHPNFNEKFEFNIPQFQIKMVTLMMSAYKKKNLLQNEMIGWIAIGSYNSSEDQLSHWNRVLNETGNEVVRWHKFLKLEYLKTII